VTVSSGARGRQGTLGKNGNGEVSVGGGRVVRHDARVDRRTIPIGRERMDAFEFRAALRRPLLRRERSDGDSPGADRL